MCGILGFWGSSLPPSLQFEKALDLISHRGPDDSGVRGFELLGKQGILGHRRLSIQDTSSAGKQPMSCSENKVHIIFNGEVYNFKELKSELTGAQFRSGSDTEVLLELYKREGTAFLEKLNGMFAFCIVDEREQRILLARDRVGIKPLYFSRLPDNNSVVFSSELKSIHSLLRDRLKIDLEALEMYLQFQYVPAPRSIFQGVEKLFPGHCLILDEKGSRIQKYWGLDSVNPNGNRFSTYEESLERLDSLLKSSISYRMIADVELGTFLSGGIDSSLVSAYAAAHSSNRIKTFSIGFEVPGFNEAEFARDIAQHLGTDHHELYVTPKEALEIIPDLNYFYDEPYADSSAIPTRIVSKLARQSVTVALSGDGGDELFCGYNRYEWMQFFVGLQRIPGTSSLLSPLLRKFPQRLVKKVGALLSWKEPWDQYRSLANIWHKGELEKLYKAYNNCPNPTLSYFRPEKSLTENLMYTDIHFYMVDDILTKVDRASMSVSLESRVPLLDHRIVELSQCMPLSYKVRDGKMKAPLRDLLARKVPREMFERSKSGFSIPLKEWLTKDLNDWMHDLLSESQLSHHGYFHQDKVNLMMRDLEVGAGDYYYQLWTLLMFQDWYNRMVRD